MQYEGKYTQLGKMPLLQINTSLLSFPGMSCFPGETWEQVSRIH